MENTLDIVIRVPANADNQSIAAALRMRAGLFEGMPAKEAASRKNTDGELNAAKPSPENTTRKTKQNKVEDEQFDLGATSSPLSDLGENGDLSGEDPSWDVDGEEDALPEPQVKHTKEDVIRALQTRVKKDGGNRDKAIATVKKFAKSGAVKDVKPEDFEKLLKALT